MVGSSCNKAEVDDEVKFDRCERFKRRPLMMAETEAKVDNVVEVV